MRGGLHEGKDVEPRIAIRQGQVRRVEGLPEGALEAGLVKPHRIVAHKQGRRPLFKPGAYGAHHFIQGGQGRIAETRRPHAGHFEGDGGRNNLGPATAPDIEPFDFVQRVIGQDGRKLQDLVEVAVQACGFGIVEDEHFNPPLGLCDAI